MFRGYSKKFQECCTAVSCLFQEYMKGVSRKNEGNLRVSQGSLKGISKIFKSYFKEAQRNLKPFQESFMGKINDF